MAVDVNDLAKHLGFASTPADTEALDRSLGAARAVITPHLRAGVVLDADQQSRLDAATLTVAGNDYRAKDAIGGQYLFSDASDVTVGLPRDPLTPVWSGLLAAGIVTVRAS